MGFFGNLLNIGKAILGIAPAAARGPGRAEILAVGRGAARRAAGRVPGFGGRVARGAAGAVAVGAGIALGESVFDGDGAAPGGGGGCWRKW